MQNNTEYAQERRNWTRRSVCSFYMCNRLSCKITDYDKGQESTMRGTHPFPHPFMLPQHMASYVLSQCRQPKTGVCVILSTLPAGKVLRTPHQGAGLRGTTETFTVLGTGDWGLAGSASSRMDVALRWAELCTTHFPTLARRACLPNRIDSWVSFRATSRP